MPKFAAFSQDATAMLREKTGSASLECYIYIDPEHEENGFALLRYPERIASIAFSEIAYDRASFASLIDGVYRRVYE